jgi:hypothetical protein
MSKKYPGGVIRGVPIVPTATSAPGIWTLCQAQNYIRQGIWPRIPGAPTIGTATDAAAGGQVSVAFTAPSETGSAAITSYTAISTPGCITGTNASSPVTVSGLTNGTAYTFRVRAVNGAGSGPFSAASNSVTPTLPVVGQQAYTTPGVYTWVAPTGVTRVSVVAVGGGGGRSGGGLGYKNNIFVTPGTGYTVLVGSGGNAGAVTSGGVSVFCSSSLVRGGGGAAGAGQGTRGTFTGDGGGNGGIGCFSGGGAGGYSGNGGNSKSAAAVGSGGGGGGCFSGCDGFGGGGVGILGIGATGGVNQGGSGGANPTVNTCVTGGAFGGGGSYLFGCGFFPNKSGAGGAVRIIWPGNTRQFPSTNTGNL